MLQLSKHCLKNQFLGVVLGGLLVQSSAWATHLMLRETSSESPQIYSAHEPSFSSYVEDSLSNAEWNLRKGLEKWEGFRFKRENEQLYFFIKGCAESSSLLEWEHLSLSAIDEIFGKQGGSNHMTVPLGLLNGNCTASELQHKTSKPRNAYCVDHLYVCTQHRLSRQCYTERLKEHCDLNFFSSKYPASYEFTFPAQENEKVKRCVEGLDLEKQPNTRGVFVTRYDWGWNPFSWGNPQGSIFFETFKKVIQLRSLFSPENK